MRYLRKNGGFTLMELLISIVVGSLVTLAATTVLLLGLRLSGHSRQTVTQQNTARVVMTMLENLASDGSMKKVVTGPDGWYICSTANELPEGEKTGQLEDKVLVAFDAESRVICTGGILKTTVTLDDNGEIVSAAYTYTEMNPILKEVHASFANLDKNNLLTVSVETEEGTYTSSTYCRLVPKQESTDKITDILEDPNIEDPIDQIVQVDNGTDKARKAFLKILHSQLDSPGVIMEKVRFTNGQESKVRYFSRDEYYAEWYNESWPKDTPWCACFIVWALDNDRWDLYGWDGEEKEAELNKWDLLRTPLGGFDDEGKPKREEKYALAHVDGFMKYLEEKEGYVADGAPEDVKHWYNPVYKSESGEWVSYKPESGDLIFFDWLVDGIQDGDHVGVVLTVLSEGETQYVYTIEGNTADKVAVRKYRINDPRIMGYGVLDWKTNDQMTAQGA